MSYSRLKLHQSTSIAITQVKRTFSNLYRTWRSSPKTKQTQTSNLSRYSFKKFNDRIISHCNVPLSKATLLCHRLREQHQPEYSAKPQPINLSGVLGLSHTRTSLRKAPKLSLDEKILIFRWAKAEREAKLAKENAKILLRMERSLLKRGTPEQGRRLSTTSSISPSCVLPTALPPKSRALDLLSEIAEEIRKRRRELENGQRQEMIERKEERRLEIKQAYQDRYKLIPSRVVPRRQTEEKQLDGQQEAERRRRNWLAKMPRTKDGKLFAYGCGNRKVWDWVKEWEKRRTPPICGKRKRVYSFTASLDERKRQRRRIK